MQYALALILLTQSATEFVIPAAEEKFAADVGKAEADLAKIKQTAGAARLKVYKEKLSEATKAGDFDKATQIKARIEVLESEPEAKAIKRPRPKDTVRFDGHAYALIKEPVPWHVAKHRCEEMGGHLVTLESVPEATFAESLCTTTEWTWMGATDEEEEGRWIWVTGKPLGSTSWIEQDHSDEQHYLAFNRLTKKWYDCNEEHRVNFVCEWDK